MSVRLMIIDIIAKGRIWKFVLKNDKTNWTTNKKIKNYDLNT